MVNGSYHGIAIGDIHFGSSKDPVELRKELNQVFMKKLEEEKETLDFVIIVGDLIDRKLSLNEVASRNLIGFVDDLIAFCYENDIVLRIIRGTRTHDFNQLENFKHFESQFNFRIINTVESEEVLPYFNVLYVPEEYMEDPDKYYAPYLEGLSEDTRYDMIFFHGTFDFVAFTNQEQMSERPLKSAPIFKAREWMNYSFGPIIGGHIHTRQAYKKKIYYTGSFSRWVYGEPNPKGFIEFFYHPETLESEVRFIDNPLAPKFDTVNLSEIIDLDASIEEKIKAIQELEKKDGNTRIKMEGISRDSHEYVMLREAFSNSKKIKIDETERLDKEREEMQDDTYSFITQGDLTIPQTIQRFIELERGIKIPVEKIEEILVEEV